MTTKNDVSHQTDNEGDGNKYFHIMLNIADDDLDVYEYRLLGHYIRICGVYGKGACWESTRTTADKTQMSTGKVSRTRNALSDKGYIKITTPDKHKKSDTLLIKVVDRWLDNMTRYSPVQATIPENDNMRSPHERECSPGETIKIQLERGTDSSAEKSAEDVAPDAPISDAKKKGDDAPRVEMSAMARAHERVDWQNKILALLTDAWLSARTVEDMLDIPLNSTDPLEFSDHPASVALYALEAERKVEYQAGIIPGGGGAIRSRRQWRLYANAKPKVDDTPEIDWQAKILATLTDDWRYARELEREFDMPLLALAPLEFSEHPAAVTLYALEAEREVEYRSLPDGRQWRLHPDGGPAPKSDEDLLMATIRRCLKVHNGSARHLTHMLRGTSKTGIYGEEAEHFKDNPVTADELEGMVDYWIERYPDIHLLKKPAKISSEMAEYRIHKAAAGKQPEQNWDVEPEEPETITIVDWGKDES